MPITMRQAMDQYFDKLMKKAKDRGYPCLRDSPFDCERKFELFLDRKTPEGDYGYWTPKLQTTAVDFSEVGDHFKVWGHAALNNFSSLTASIPGYHFAN